MSYDGYHRCESCGFYIEDGTATLCDQPHCPEMAKERERPPLIIGDDEQPHYFGRP